MENETESPRYTNYNNKDYLTFYNIYGKVLPFQMMVFATSGHGKGLSTESIIEEWKEATGGVVLCISDPKAEAEFSFVQYEPIEKYHTISLMRDGKPKAKYSAKLYHPFTFNIPRGFLPEINFYTIPIKSLTREEMGILAETSFDSEAIRLMGRVTENLFRGDGIFNFLYEVEQLVQGSKDKKKEKRDPKNFYLKVGGGTAKSITEISGLLSPFKREYFLRPETCENRINWQEILTDSENYHVFLSMWIKDEKIKQFCILNLLKQIIANRHFAKKPLLIVLPELRVICPRNPQGYKFYLSQAITDAMSTMRSQGRGISSLGDSQNWSDTDDKIKGSATVTFFGKLSTKDQEVVTKASGYKREQREQLQKMPRNSYYLFGQEDLEPFRTFLPGHMHKEPHYNWIEMYKKYYGNRMKRYDELKVKMRKELKLEENFMEEIMNTEIRKRKEEQERKRKEREASEKSGTESKDTSGTEKEVDSKKLTIMKLAWEMRNDRTLHKKDKSYQAIANKLDISKGSVSNYIQRYADYLVEKKEGDINNT